MRAELGIGVELGVVGGVLVGVGVGVGAGVGVGVGVEVGMGLGEGGMPASYEQLAEAKQKQLVTATRHSVRSKE